MQAAVVPAVNSSWQVKDACKRHLLHRCTPNARTLPRTIPPNPRSRAGRRDRGRGSRRHHAKIGDRVGTAWIQSTCGRCEWCQRGRRMFCPYLKGTAVEAQGGHAEYMLMNAEATYLIPDKVSCE
jgi:alcohol dehydrogenase